ncbi:MAG: alanyl-tRNA editing protein [Dongiaceae bacterium]
MELIFRDDPYAKSCVATVTAADARGILLDRTVFYAEGGGQPGDIGVLTPANGAPIVIIHTKMGEGPDDVLHIPAEGSVLPAPGTKVAAEIDWARRDRLMRMHTCLHLLCSVVVGDVTGGQVGDGKGRLDFNLPDTKLDKDHITAELNRLIKEDHPVRPRWIADEELSSRPELVRTMAVKPPLGHGRVRLLDIEGVDLQPCGGTHVSRTGEIGQVEVTKIENKGRQNRRVNLALVS